MLCCGFRCDIPLYVEVARILGSLLSARALIASALLRPMIDQSGSINPSILKADQLIAPVIGACSIHCDADAVDTTGVIVSIQTIASCDGERHDQKRRRHLCGLHACLHHHGPACAIRAGIRHHRRAQRHGRQLLRPERSGLAGGRQDGDRGDGRDGAGQAGQGDRRRPSEQARHRRCGLAALVRHRGRFS